MKFLDLFTRKPKRSEWMQGLLWAEEGKQLGWSDSWIRVLRLEEHPKGGIFDDGVSDYIHHSFHVLQSLENKQ